MKDGGMFLKQTHKAGSHYANSTKKWLYKTRGKVTLTISIKNPKANSAILATVN